MVHFVIFEKWASNYEMSIGILWVHTMCCDIANYFCQKCPILSFCERLVYFSLLQFCQKWSILSFCERTVDFFRFFNFVKIAQFCHFLREESVFFFHFFSFVINGPFCHIWKVDFKLWDWHKYTMSTHYVLWYSKLFLSKMPHFVILWEARVFFRFFNFVKKCPILSFSERAGYFFHISILSKMVHFVIIEKWTSKYEISISIVWVPTMCCDISNYFCQKCPILSFCERLVYFFASSILSKMLNFVILWEDCGFFFASSILSKCSILSFWERTVNFFTSSILSNMLNFVIFLEGRVFFSHFNIVKNGPFCHFEKWTSNYEFSISILWVHTMCCDIVNYFCHKCPILSFWERLVYFFASSILSKMLNFVIFWERKVFFFSLFQFCQKWSILSFLKSGLQIMR